MGENMVSIRISKSASKLEEVKVLEKLHDEFKGTDLYLESLFSTGLLNWVRQAIMDDVCPDIHDWMDSAVRDLQGKLVEANRSRDNMEAEKKMAISQHDEANMLLMKAEEQRDQAQNNLNREIQLHHESRMQINRLEQELEEAKDELKAWKRHYERKVADLKAKLYDVEHPEELKANVTVISETSWAEIPVENEKGA